MDELQAEIKAIKAELNSIRVNKNMPRHASPTLLEPALYNQSGGLEQSANESILPADIRKTRLSRNSPDSKSYSPNGSTSHSQGNGRQKQPSQAKRAGKVDRQQQPSETDSRRLQLFEIPQPSTPEQGLEQALQQLEERVQKFNQLATAQESAMLELKAIAEKLEQDWKLLEMGDLPQTGWTAADLMPLPVIEYAEAAVPVIQKNQEGVFVVTTRSIDLFKAEREAASMAEALRYRASGRKRPRQSAQSIGRRLWDWLCDAKDDVLAFSDAAAQPQTEPPMPPQASLRMQVPSSAPSQPRRIRKPPRAGRSRSATPVSESDFSLPGAALLVIGSAVARVLLDILLASQPGLWLPVVLVLATPAAIAVYRTSVAPQSGFIWGYRLFLIMIGLLIGGRL
jgi:hypothetical protein